MAFQSQGGPSFQTAHPLPCEPSPRPNAPALEIFEWYPHYKSCTKYFLDYAQHSPPVQALGAFLNIQLPCQKRPFPVMSASQPSSPRAAGPEMPPLRPQHAHAHALALAPGAALPAGAVSLVPYIRRLVVTGHDSPGVLHGFFGDDWQRGIGQLHEIERRNYMFAAKAASWLTVKQAYDMSPEETVPYLSPLLDTSEKEIQMAESTWSEWLAMQDWMLGPRSPGPDRSPRVKREARE
ncbi:hypothetical protein PZA11_005209 [Diplocarpon coronariae]|nr:hypothetical protein JHW43_004491 [Diplocarpon mali]